LYKEIEKMDKKKEEGKDEEGKYELKQVDTGL
jgi:hypothetical protein